MIATSPDAPNHNPAAALDTAELRCPERRFDIIAAERCLQTESCPREKTCSMRKSAVVSVRNARKEGGVPDSPHKRACRTPIRDCYCCSQTARKGAMTCSAACEAKMVSYRAAMAAGGRGSSAVRTGKSVGFIDSWRGKTSR